VASATRTDSSSSVGRAAQWLKKTMSAVARLGKNWAYRTQPGVEEDGRLEALRGEGLRGHLGQG
jgi:hypothetical protein